jgi:hypothetical protein
MNKLAVPKISNIYDILNENPEIPTKRRTRQKKSVPITVSNSLTNNSVGISNPEPVSTWVTTLQTADDNIQPDVLSSNDIILSWNDISETIQSYAIYRIRSYYISLNQNLTIFDKICQMHPEISPGLREKYGYLKWINDEYSCRKCLMIYIELTNIKKCAISIIDLLTTSTYNYEALIDQIDGELKGIVEDINANIEFFQDQLSDMSKIVDDIYGILYCMDLGSIDKISTDHFINEKNIDGIKNTIGNIDEMIMHLVLDNDVDIKCEYYVSLNDGITRIGINYATYLSCDEEITLDILSDCFEVFNFYDISHESIDNIVTPKYTNECHFFEINTDYRKHRFKCSFDNSYTSLKIDNLPPNTKIMTSIYRTLNLNS